MALSLVTGAGCSTARKTAGPGPEVPGAPAGQPTPAPSPTEAMGPPEPFGPPAPVPSEPYGPEPATVRPVVLVLGPGLARGYAAAGALRALSDAKIQIGAVMGTEMGSLMAGLYAMNPKINKFEWALKRFKAAVFLDRKNFFAKVLRVGEARPLDRELATAFGAAEFKDTQIPLRVALVLKNSGLAQVVEQGPLVTAVRAAVAVPGVIDEGEWEGIPAMAATQVRPFLIDEAKALGLGPVVAVDSAENSKDSDLKDADVVIRPDLSGIGPMDFAKITEIVWRGKNAATQKLAEIKKLTNPATGATP